MGLLRPAMRIPKRIPKTALLLTLTALAFAPVRAGAVAGEWSANEQSRVRLITPYKTMPRDGEIRLGLHFTLTPEWHVYWKNSGDAGFPPALTFAVAAGLGEPEILWPAPNRFELPGDLVAFGYGEEVVYPLRATLAGAPGDRLKISADLDYLVCKVDCVPYRYTLTVDQPLGDAGVPDPETAPLLDAWQARLPVAAESLPGVEAEGSIDASRPDAPVLEVRLRGVRAGQAGQGTPDLFLETHEAFGMGSPRMEAADGGVLFRVPLEPLEADKPLPRETAFAWTATGLTHGGRPVAVEARRTVALRTAPAAVALEEEAGDAGLSFGHPFGDPIPAALLATVSALAALWLWGVLGRSGGERSARPLREGLGFAAAAVTVGLLYALSRQVSFEGLAWIELTLLTMALCAWLRGKAGHRRALGFLLALAVAACALAAPWLADRNRLALPGGASSPIPSAVAPLAPAG